MWRPSPLYRAHRWEKALDTPAKIYYKWEGVSPAGSHKPNTAVAQCYYAKQEGSGGLRHRDRGRAVGQRPVLCRPTLRPEVQGLYGGRQLPAEALPAHHDGDLGRPVVPSPSTRDPCRPRHPGQGPGDPRQPGHGHQRGHRVRRDPPGVQVLAGQRGQLRAAAPDGDRAGGHEADGDGRRLPGHPHRLRGRRQQCRRPDLSRS